MRWREVEISCSYLALLRYYADLALVFRGLGESDSSHIKNQHIKVSLMDDFLCALSELTDLALQSPHKGSPVITLI
jgi:hypothetical protein